VTRIRMAAQPFSPTPASAVRRAGPPRRGRSALAAAVLLAIAATAGPAAATLYKWVDANGRVVYSDQPPPASVKPEIVPPPPPPANPNAAKELEDRTLAIKQQEKKRAEAAKAADKTEQASQARREACVNALGQMKAMQKKGERVFRYNEKGEKVYFDDSMRREAIERLQQIARDNCPG
jgi:hypothetical protein